MFLFYIQYFNSCQVDGKVKYAELSSHFTNMENNTLDISWPDVQNYNEQLAAAISEEYYRYVSKSLGLNYFVK